MRRRRLRPGGGTWRAVGFAAAAALAFGALSVAVHVNAEQLGQLRSDAEELSDQVEDMGGTPRATPAPPPLSGQDGEDGRDGTRGPRGLPGSDGDDGEDGRDGTPGADGGDGEDGSRGQQGERGEQGERGARGETGAKGDRGEQGQQGEPGRPPTGGEIDDAVDRWCRANGCAPSPPA